MISVFQERVDTAQHKVNDVQQRVNAAKRGVDAAQKKVDAAPQKVLAVDEAKTLALAEALAEAETKALAEAEAETKALAEAEAEAKVEIEAVALMTNPLQDLATDCLWLSMHFFHPIQLCAQHVYHSALPLLPTSSHLQRFYLQNSMDKQLSCVAAFLGAPDTWGLLLRTIDFRPRQLTSITTSLQRIIVACEDIVNIYDAVTFVLQQSLCAPEAVTKIQGSPDGSVLFFAHPLSVTMWDVQTGGLIHTLTTKSKINDFAVSTTGGHIACGLSDGFVTFWDVHTKRKGPGFGNGQPVVAVHWWSPLELVIATQNSVYVYDIGIGKTWDAFPTPGPVWGMVRSVDGCELFVGTSQSSREADWDLCILEPTRYTQGHLHHWQSRASPGWKSPPHGRLMHPMCVGNEITCITPPSGVQSFDTNSHDWANNPPPLDAATSLAVSLNRNLVAQTKDSIQIFSLDVLKTSKARDDVHPSHVYPLGEEHIICLQPDGYLTLLELETLQKIHPSDNTPLLGTLLSNQLPPSCVSAGHGPIAELGIPAVIQAWQSGIALPKWTEVTDEEEPLGGSSPNQTRVITVYGSPKQELLLKGVRSGITLAKAPLEFGDMGMGKVYDLTFDSETRFYLKAEGPGWHVQIPYDITGSPAERYPYKITQGEPVPLSEPRVIPLFTLDTNCEWVIDAESRKVCWISPGNLRRGNGGHFWAGLSLVMLGDDGVVRKLTLKEPDC